MLYIMAVDRIEPLEVYVKRASLVAVFCVLLLPSLVLADTITFGPNGTGKLHTSLTGVTTTVKPGVIAITTPDHPYSGISIGNVTISSGILDTSQSGTIGNTTVDAFEGLTVTVQVNVGGAGTLTESFTGDFDLNIIKSGSGTRANPYLYNFELSVNNGTGTATTGFASYYLGSASLTALSDINLELQGTLNCGSAHAYNSCFGDGPYNLGTLTMTSGSETFEATPESATLSLVGIGLFGLLGLRRRRDA